MTKWKGFEESGRGLLKISAFAWSDRIKSRKVSVRKSSVPAENQTEHLPNTSPQYYDWTNLSMCVYSYKYVYVL